MVQQHLESFKSLLTETVSEALKSMYMDDFFSGAPTVAGAQKLKQEAIEILSEAKLDLLKRHSNFFEIETNS